MKKALLAMSMMAMLSWTPAQAIDFYCEPEDDYNGPLVKTTF